MKQERAVSAYGRARRLSSRYCFGVIQHLERIEKFRTNESDDLADHQARMQNKNNWEIVIIFLSRLRRCLVYLSNFEVFRRVCEEGIVEFDAIVPHLKNLRDYEEHFDAYSTEKGHNKSFGWGELESYWFGSEEFSSGVGKISQAEADQASRSIWKVIESLESSAKNLGYLSWDDRFAPNGKYRSTP